MQQDLQGQYHGTERIGHSLQGQDLDTERRNYSLQVQDPDTERRIFSLQVQDPNIERKDMMEWITLLLESDVWGQNLEQEKPTQAQTFPVVDKEDTLTQSSHAETDKELDIKKKETSMQDPVPVIRGSDKESSMSMEDHQNKVTRTRLHLAPSHRLNSLSNTPLSFCHETVQHSDFMHVQIAGSQAQGDQDSTAPCTISQI